MIQCKNLSIGYDKAIVEDINLELDRGQILAVLGPNGVGKTTLFKTILGFLRPLKGSIYIDGKDQSHYSQKEFSKKLAYVPQSTSHKFPFSAFKVVLMGRTPHLNSFSSPKKEDEEKAAYVMDLLKISHLAKKSFSNLSGGERQKVLVARAICQEPDYLIMDEPTSALDYGNAYQVLDQVLKLKDKGYSIIMTTHSPDQALKLGSRVLLINKEKEVKVGLAQEIITEGNLREAYGIDTVISSASYQGLDIPFCTPVF